MRRLVIRPGAIGDLIVSLPALEQLRTDEFEIWTTGSNVPLIRFAQARSIASTGLDLLGVAEVPAPLMERLRSFDSIISWYGSNRAEFRQAVERLPFEFFAALPPNDSVVHATDFYLNQIQHLINGPIEMSHRTPRIPCAVPKGDYAVIHPFSGSPRKNWPIEKFHSLASRLRMPVRWCAGADDPPLPDAVHIPDLYELACFLAGARLYIGNDSGITHLAAAVGTSTLAIFGPTNPAIWAPRGDHVRVVRTKMEVEG